MALTQQTFIDQLRQTEMELREVVGQSVRTADRLVGCTPQGGEGVEDYGGEGIFGDVEQTARRMSKLVAEVRANLGRIYSKLPEETANTPINATGRSGY